MVRRIVIVGCGVSGTTAAFYARKTDRTAEITIVGSETLPEYSRCGLPSPSSEVFRNPDSSSGTNKNFKKTQTRMNSDSGLTATKSHPNAKLSNFAAMKQ